MMKPKQVIKTRVGVPAVAGVLPAKLPQTSLPGLPMPPSSNSPEPDTLGGEMGEEGAGRARRGRRASPRTPRARRGREAA